MNIVDVANRAYDNNGIISENNPKIHDSGYNKGKDDGIIIGREEGYSQSQSDFWDGFQDFGNRQRYAYAFDSWSGAEEINPKYLVKPTSDSPYMFNRCTKLKRVDGSKFDFSAIPQNYEHYNRGLYALFNKCSSLEEVNMNFVDTMSYAYFFAFCTNLKSVKTLKVSPQSVFGGTNGGDCFAGCSSLEEVVFEGEIGNNLGLSSCSRLTNASVDNIIDHLADLTGQAAKKLTLHSTTLDNLTDEQLNKIIDKNWTTS